MKALDLGCGNRKLKNAIGVDRIRTKKTDIICDLNQGIPFRDNTFDLIFSSHTLEHLDDIVFTMEEIHRVAKPKAKVILILPFFSWSYTFQDVTHKHFFGYYSFDTFTEMQNVEEKFVHYSRVRFKIKNRRILFAHYEKGTRGILKLFESFANRFPQGYQRLFAFIIPAVEVYFEFWVIKDL